MSKFKVGDKVRLCENSEYCTGYQPHPKNVIGMIVGIWHWADCPCKVKWVDGRNNFYPEKDLVLVERGCMEKKYKLETELTLQQVLQLRALVGACSNMDALYKEIGHILSEGRVKYSYFYLGDFCSGFSFKKFQDNAKQLVEESKRKVVTIGDKQYYEDELQTALSNIKPI